MPHLRYCNRYWYVSGDELSCPALCSLISRILWTALVAAVYGVSRHILDDCKKGWVLEAYLLISIIVFVSAIIVDACIIFVSLQGMEIVIRIDFVTFIGRNDWRNNIMERI
jgi:hypothetical protein